MERQEKGDMEISGSSVRHRTLQQTQTEADNAPTRQSGRGSNAKFSSRVFLIIWDISDINKNIYQQQYKIIILT